MRWTASLLCLCLIAAAAHGAEKLPSRPQLPVELARKAVQAALDQCAKDGYQVSAAVVDRAGVLKAQLRADDAGPHTIDSSRNKAYTAASLDEATSRLAKLVADNPQLAALGHMNDSILVLGGGLPIQFDGETVGGIGVGGAPGSHLDEACARAGLEAIGARPRQFN